MRYEKGNLNYKERYIYICICVYIYTPTCIYFNYLRSLEERNCQLSTAHSVMAWQQLIYRNVNCKNVNCKISFK